MKISEISQFIVTIQRFHSNVDFWHATMALLLGSVISLQEEFVVGEIVHGHTH